MMCHGLSLLLHQVRYEWAILYDEVGWKALGKARFRVPVCRRSLNFKMFGEDWKFEHGFPAYEWPWGRAAELGMAAFKARIPAALFLEVSEANK